MIFFFLHYEKHKRQVLTVHTVMLILFVSFIQTVIFGSYMIAQGFFNVYAMCVDTLFLCFCKYASFSVLLVTVYKRQRCYDDYRWNIKKLRVSSWLYGFPLSQPFLNYNFNWFLFFHCFNSILACLSWLFISTETLLCFLFLLPGCNSVCCLQFLLILSQCLDLVSGEDLERNDGSSSRPYYMSPGLHKILRKGEESAKSCAASWALCSHLLKSLLTFPYLLYVQGSGHLRASTVGLNMKTVCIPAQSGMTWTWKDLLLLPF